MSTNTGNLGPSGGAQAFGAVATSSSVNNENNSVNTQTTTTTDSKVATQIQTAYAPNIGLGAQSQGNTITSTSSDFGALGVAQNIATTALNTNAQGFSILSTLTGRALDDATKGINSQTRPLGETLSKYASYIVGAIVLGVVGVAFFTRGKK